MSFFEHQPQVPELLDSWLTGYRRVLSLPAEDEAEIWTFILFRRLLLVAWIGSHAAGTLRKSWAPGIRGTAATWLSYTSAANTQRSCTCSHQSRGDPSVVTGGTRGIGKGIARVFAASGARVLIVGRDEEAAATSAVAGADRGRRRGLVRAGRRQRAGGLPADRRDRGRAAGRR